MESAFLGRNHRNFVCVLLSYRTFSQAWAFHPKTAVSYAACVAIAASLDWIKSMVQ